MSNTKRYCDEHKLEKQPYKQAGYKDGIKWYCPECKRVSNRKAGKRRTANQKAYAAHILRTYNLSWQAYEAMLEGQQGRCAICGRTPEGHHYDRLVVDHDHATNVVRGLLCQPCNVMLGKAEDRPEVLEAAAEYLRNRSTG